MSILTDPISFEMHHLFSLSYESFRDCTPRSNSHLPKWKSKSRKPSPKFIQMHTCIYSLQWHFSDWDWRYELPSEVYKYLSISAESILWFPFWEKGFFVVTCQNWEVPLLIRNTVCFLDLSESRGHKPQFVRIPPLWVTKHILFTSLGNLLLEKVFYLHYL